MRLKSKKVSLGILAVTSVLCSRAMFVFIDDPEGPNLLVVFVMAMVIYVPSLLLYIPNRWIPNTLSSSGLRRLLMTVLVQVLMATALYFVLRYTPPLGL